MRCSPSSCRATTSPLRILTARPDLGRGKLSGRRLRRSKDRGRRPPLRRPTWSSRGGQPRAEPIAGAWKGIEERGNFEGRWSLKEINDRVHEAEPNEEPSQKEPCHEIAPRPGSRRDDGVRPGAPGLYRIPKVLAACQAEGMILLSLDLDFSNILVWPLNF